MSDNPLMDRNARGSGKVTEERLIAHIMELNSQNWVRSEGRPYFLNRRVNADGETLHFVDRNG